MVEHTPGIWLATERSGYHEILAPDANSNWYGRANMHAVAYCDTEISEGEQLANARLIAAAPELLVAGVDAVDVLTDYLGFLRTIPGLWPHPYIPGVEQCLDNLRAAIAKARCSHEG